MEKHDPRLSLPKPSRYAARTPPPMIGDEVIYAGQRYLVASLLDMSKPIYPNWPTGLHFALRNPGWVQTVFLIVPAELIEVAQELVA